MPSVMPPSTPSLPSPPHSGLLFTRLEFAGSLGDLGTLLPIGIAMIVVNGMQATSVMFMAGLVYILAGSYFRVPISVEPMKVIGALAIAMHLSPLQISLAALAMGVLTLLLGLSGCVHWLGRHTPRSVIRGVQLAGGITLMVKAIDFIIKKDPQLPAGELYGLHLGLLLGLAGLLATLLLLNNRRIPAALVVVGGGLLAGLLLGKPLDLTKLQPGLYLPQLFPYGSATWQDLLQIIPLVVLPQIPMTVGNAIFSSSDLLKGYYGDQARRVNYGAIATSQGLAGIASFLVGGLPMCHGAGGIASHYIFGARTNGANLMIGTVFITLGLFFGDNALAILNLLPRPVLGVLLLFAGAQLALMVADLNSKKELFVAMAMLATTLALNLGVAFILGLLLAWLLHSERLQV